MFLPWIEMEDVHDGSEVLDCDLSVEEKFRRSGVIVDVIFRDKRVKD